MVETPRAIRADYRHAHSISSTKKIFQTEHFDPKYYQCWIMGKCLSQSFLY